MSYQMSGKFSASLCSAIAFSFPSEPTWIPKNVPTKVPITPLTAPITAVASEAFSNLKIVIISNS